MLTATEVPGTAIVELDMDSSGPGDGLDEASMRAARETVERVAAEQGHVRLLGVIGRIGHVSVGALREDLKTIRDAGRIDRVAVVTDTAWMKLAAKAEARVLGLDLRGFRRSQLEDARAWLRDP